MTDLENQKNHKMDSRARQVEQNIKDKAPVNRIIARAQIHKSLKTTTPKVKDDLSHLGKHD